MRVNELRTRIVKEEQKEREREVIHEERKTQNEMYLYAGMSLDQFN